MYFTVPHISAGGNELWCRKSCCGVLSLPYSEKKKKKKRKENNSEPYGSLIKLSVNNPLTSIPDGLRLSLELNVSCKISSLFILS